ncbi:PIN domain nuclease, a component of toxin-antitoxin system (PIN domain) [Candidatus Electrothrix marina]|uniref:PIN domain nuclease, a component of toxin-antitoxin system (PIN domain) n=1 Tax=Candidatus Electrothrix marina TaxID=1859130 RepID=A0A444JFD4_9BACT|nr:PIN domain nuclease, a component of toxin-antitoxin system (PIN domain) [Candidatus Electrothrix marina]
MSGTTIYLDTHVVVWLYSGDLSLLSEKACQLIEENELLISPLVLLELQYLFEIKRITVEPTVIFDSLAESIGLQKCRSSFARVMTEAMLMSWTRDPFDRIITATAVVHQAVLLTKDQMIRREYELAAWD